jgi:hypothetical protein
VVDRLALGLLPTAITLVHLLPWHEPAPGISLVYDAPPPPGERPEPTVVFGDPYPFPALTESDILVTAIGIALAVAVVLSWRAVHTRPEAALATALVLVSVAYPVAWVLHGYAVWPTILVPLGAAIALTLRAAHAQHPQLGLHGLELQGHELRHVELPAEHALHVGEARPEVAQGADQLEPRERPLVVDPVARCGARRRRHEAAIGVEADRLDAEPAQPGQLADAVATAFALHPKHGRPSS